MSNMADNAKWQYEEIKNLEMQLEKCRDMAMALGIECNGKQQSLEKAIDALEFIADDIACSGNVYLLKYINETLEELK